MTPDTPTQAAALPELLPCPFCGHASARPVLAASEMWVQEHGEGESFPHSETWAVMCDASSEGGRGGCGASGGFKPSELEASEAWNRRALALQEAHAELDALRAERDRLTKMDSEAATHVETVICTRTAFTGEPPYVGWAGLGRALTEALDERDALRAALKPFADCAAEYMAGGIYEVYVSGNDLISARAAISAARKEGAQHD